MPLTPVRNAPNEFEYGLMARHQGLLAASFGMLVVGTILTYSTFSDRPLGKEGDFVAIGLLLLLLLMGVAWNRISRRWLGMSCSPTLAHFV